ncbi:hemolysin III family protein [Corynebacterium lizhenjunii]|uniref:Hemolysin III family protein n=1 Tax=Corynebacterium lizhenjunii TaxID=2709394 RepID=A0A7T0KHT1_9CORY|nr:hemolysin III family protein [Corynebacterium lizhenjunii]
MAGDSQSQAAAARTTQDAAQAAAQATAQAAAHLHRPQQPQLHSQQQPQLQPQSQLRSPQHGPRPGLAPAARGERPRLRGWIHAVAAAVFFFAALVLGIFAWVTLPAGQALAVNVYAVCSVALFAVSGAYHLVPWRLARTVAWWRRADHSTIAVFIAATYTPLLVLTDSGTMGRWILAIAWVGAVAAVALNLLWPTHPRWLGVAVYLVLGWLVVPLIPHLWRSAGPAVVWLLAAGGLIYTAGAVVYGARWPGRQARLFGYHEYFHSATVAAAISHAVAVWLVAA